MKRNFLIWSLLLLLAPAQLIAQKSPMAYYFEGDEVVFQFDSRMYEKATEDGTKKTLDFADLDIYKVAVSGNFNNWSRGGWKMKKVGPYNYQLRKKIKAF